MLRPLPVQEPYHARFFPCFFIRTDRKPGRPDCGAGRAVADRVSTKSAGKIRRRGAELAPFLGRLVERYHRPEYLGSDPLALVHEFSRPDDREMAALFAALLAYGNVKQIQRSLRTLFSGMGGHPGRFVRDFRPAEASARLHGFKHRFTDSEDVLCLCWLLHQAVERAGSLETAFLLGDDLSEPDLTGTASRFVDYLAGMEFAPHFDRERMLARSSFKHLLPRADRGSACKRIHLFLRWVIRPDDGIDLGLWRSVSPARLLMPVDTHVLRIGKHLGLLAAGSGSLRAAREITEALRGADPDDPVRFDFALCRIGILKACPTLSNLTACRACEMHDVCRKRKSLERAARRRNF